MTVDPRPTVVAEPDGCRVEGWRCPSCAWTSVSPSYRCPSCGGAVEQARFGPGGHVWASTVVRIRVPGREPPYVLAYVDLDGGPRVLAHLDASIPAPLVVGSRVRMVLPRADGDLRVVAS